MKMKIGSMLVLAGTVILAGCGAEQVTNTENIEEFVDYTITGVEPGAGITEAAHNTLDAYENLQGWTLQESSTAGMLA
nr:glycine/betaine ABC transporter [Enterococcus sp.]